MPEAVEIKIISDYLHQNWTNKILISLGWDSKSKFSKEKNRIKGLELVKVPCRIEGVYSRGKLIIIECINRDEETIYMVSQLGMEGKWVNQKSNHSNFYLCFGNLNSDKTAYQIEDQWYFDDSRHFGHFNVYNNMDEPTKSHGPCLLTTALYDPNTKLKPYQPTMSLVLFTENIKNKRIKTKELCDYLLDQKKSAGIGNYLRAEIMYRCNFNPRKTLGSFTDPEIKLLYDTIMLQLRMAYLNNGLTIRTYVDPEGHIGKCPMQVYKKETDPHGNPVETFKDKQKRTVHWVPLVQNK